MEYNIDVTGDNVEGSPGNYLCYSCVPEFKDSVFWSDTPKCKMCGKINNRVGYYTNDVDFLVVFESENS